MLWIIIALVIPVVYLWYQITYRRKIQLAAKIPGPAPTPFFGNILMYLNKNPDDILTIFADLQNKFGSIYRVWVGPFQVAFFLGDPKDMEVVLSSNRLLKKNHLYEFLVPWLGRGLLISDGKKWHSRRKIITPTFHFKILEQFLETFNKKGLKLIEQMRKTVTEKGDIVDVYPFINLCTLDIISETAMGIELNSQDNQNTDYVEAVVRMSEIAANRFIKVWMRNEFIFSVFYSKMKKEQDACIKLMHDFTDKIIQQRRSKLIGNGSNEGSDEVDNDTGIKKKMALLDVLLNARVNGEALTNADIREEVDTFMFEGHDTTTSGLCFALYAISKRPEVEKKIYEELKTVMGGKEANQGLSYSDMGELKYLEMVIKESLRLYPPVPLFGRRTEEEIEINGVTIPADCNVSMCPYLLGRDPSIYPNPDKFDPERFNLENMQDKNPFSYIPFSAGPRNCIGQKFAMMELKSVLSKVIYNFELYESGIEPIITTEIVLRSRNGFKVGMRLRK